MGRDGIGSSFKDLKSSDYDRVDAGLHRFVAARSCSDVHNDGNTNVSCALPYQANLSTIAMDRMRFRSILFSNG